MNKVAIVSDSVFSLPQELIQRYGIRVVPLHIIWGDKDYRDGVDITAEDFYKLMKSSQELPTSSAPSTEQYLEAFQEASKKASGVACILMSSRLTNHNPAFQAKEMLKEKLPNFPVEIIDSKTVIGAQGLIVLRAAEAASQEKELPEVLKVAKDINNRVNTLFAVDTLKYLARGGRIGKAASWAGSLLNVKPIIEVPVSSGIVTPVERVRTKRKALERMISIMAERVGTKPLHVIIDHCDAVEEAEWLRDRVSSQFDCLEIYVCSASPVVGLYPGPGSVGPSFYA